MVAETHSRAGFSELIKEFHPVIRKVSSMYFQDAEDQKDLYQEILFQLWRSMPTFESRSSISTWVYRVALNTAITYFRKERRRLKTVEINEDAYVVACQDDLIRKEELALLRTKIECLSKIERAMVLLYLEAHSHEEIARIIGISRNHVAVKMHRIRDKLKGMMQEKP